MPTYPDIEKGSLARVSQNKPVSDHVSDSGTTWGTWLWHHGSQLAKGCVALVGLVLIGSVGYVARGWFGYKKNDNTGNDIKNAQQISDTPNGIVIKSSANIATVNSPGSQSLQESLCEFPLVDEVEIETGLVGFANPVNSAPILTSNQLTVAQGKSVILTTSNLNVTDPGDPSGTGLIRTLTGHTDYVLSVAFNPVRDLIASGSSDKFIKIWNTTDGSLVRTLMSANGISSIAFNPAGNQIASSLDMSVKIWNINGSLVRTLTGHQGVVRSVVFSPTGDKIASGSGYPDSAIKIWNAVDGSLERTLPGHSNGVMSVAFSPTGDKIASGSSDRSIKIWNVDGSLLHTLTTISEVFSVAFNPAGNEIASGGLDNYIMIWSGTDGSLVRKLVGSYGATTSLCYNKLGDRLVSGGYGKSINIWNTVDGSLMRTLTGHTHYVGGIAFNPLRNEIVSASYDKTVKIWTAHALFFIAGNVQHGRFERISAAGNSTTTFSLQEIQNGQIRFVHNGDTVAPSYAVAVNNGFDNSTIPVPATISYIMPTLQTNQLAVNEGQTAFLSLANLNAKDADPTITFEQLSFTVSDLQHGIFAFSNDTKTAITAFNQQQVAINQTCFVHDKSKFAPSYLIAVNDGYVSSSAASATIQYSNLPPMVQANQLILKQGESIVITIANLYANDIDTSITSAAILCNITYVQHGNFKKNSDIVNIFTLQDIQNNLIRFAHDGSKFAPDYYVIFDDGYARTEPLVPEIYYSNSPLLLSANQVVFKEGENLIITAANLNATDTDPTIKAEQITFTISSIEHCLFAHKNFTVLPLPITNFTFRDVLDEEIILQHDKSKHAPSYAVAANDGYVSSTPVPAQITYENLAPFLKPDRVLNIYEGQRLNISTVSFDADVVDPSILASNVVFSISKLQHGNFTRIASNKNIYDFSLQDVLDNRIAFTHDNSKFKPYFVYTVSDGYDVSWECGAGSGLCWAKEDDIAGMGSGDPLSSLTLAIQYRNLPAIISSNQLAIMEGGTTQITLRNLNATDVDPSISQLSIMFEIRNEQHCLFEEVGVAGTPIYDFTLEDVKSGKLRVVHDGSRFPPSYMVRTNDTYALSDLLPANITFNNLPANLQIEEGGYQILSAENFKGATTYTYVVTEVQHGQFEANDVPGIPISNFTLENLYKNEISFVHDSGKFQPSYSFKIISGYEQTDPIEAMVDYTNLPPKILANWLKVNEGDVLNITTSNFNAVALYPKILPTNITFGISNLQNGEFTRKSLVTTNFTLQDILDRKIIFTHTGGELEPDYWVIASDGYNNAERSHTIVNFNSNPRLITASLEITQGATVTLGLANLAARKNRQFLSELLFTLTNVTQGYFSNRGETLNHTLCNFLQGDVINGYVHFTHDGSVIAPTYNVKVSDNRFISPVNATQVTFHLTPGLSTGAIFGIVASVIAVLGVGAFGIFVCAKRGSRKQISQDIDLLNSCFIGKGLVFGKQLGRGATADVYQGTYDGTKVAIKVFSGDIASIATDFRKEVSLMMKLRHPNVVLLYGGDLDTTNHHAYLVMEFMGKGSLYDVLHAKDKYPLPWQIRMRMALQAASSVAFLHTQQIVHRDIKSQNFLVNEDMTIKISDFGASKIVKNQQATSMTTSIGTPFWSAPEVLNGHSATSRSDVFSLVVVLWELLTRTAPYEEERGRPIMRTVMAIMMEGKRVLIPTWTPKFYSEIIRKGMAEQPEARMDASDITRYLTEHQMDRFAPVGTPEEVTRLKEEQPDLFQSMNRALSLSSSASVVKKKNSTVKFNSPREEEISEPLLSGRKDLLMGGIN